MELRLIVEARTGKSIRSSRLLLARARGGGLFELLTPAAWAAALGYFERELGGKFLHDVMELQRPQPGGLAAALLDNNERRSVDVTLQCKDGGRKAFRLHRRLDAYEPAVFFVADEILDRAEERSPGEALAA